MALITCEMWSKGIKIAFFPKNCLADVIASGSLGSAPTPPSGIHLNYSKLLYSNTFLDLDSFAFLLLFKPSPLNEFLVTRQHQATLLIFLSTISLPPQNYSFEVFDDVIACDLWLGAPPIKNPGYAYGCRYHAWKNCNCNWWNCN